MPAISLRFMGAVQLSRGCSHLQVDLPDGATVGDLETRLRALDLDPSSTAIIITLNGRGLRQWPPDRPLSPGDEVAVFPRISGGGEGAHPL